MAPITIVGSIRLASRYGRVIRLAILVVSLDLHKIASQPILSMPDETGADETSYWGHLSRFPPCLTRLTWRLILRRYPES